MNVFKNLNISLKANLKTGGATGVYQNVVQKGHVGSGYIYAMQLHKDTDKNELNSVLRATPTSTPSTPITYGNAILNMKSLAGGHSQTWEYAGKKGQWFIGTKGVNTANDGYNWATQIARVTIPPDTTTHYTNTDFPRLSHLSSAGNQEIELRRAEAAVSPNYTYFLIATIDLDGNGYFSLYYLDDVNNALTGKSAYSIANLTPVSDFPPFKISNMTQNVSKTIKPGEVKIGSIQGYDIDETVDKYNNKQVNIYISSEYSPDKGGQSEKRHIYKIPWGATDKSDWTDIDLSRDASVDYNGYPTEFESVQVIGENHLYLTVAYHGYYNKVKNGKKVKTWGTIANRIYEVSWENE
ncbi:helveticin J family class III bacteriocin [Lactobacillus xylocopicola]|uniref:Bacteriocin n=1 Tax=Lactobacillus xylocopicola TaxID=2976676 RepID=A0ABN6SHS8_9LACO|nr:helveticin J family class III bacteriocin [Lactobacillus xylocopicola]BDR59857.1 bacteriocin [Lactobacillus xylocopicola]